MLNYTVGKKKHNNKKKGKKKKWKCCNVAKPIEHDTVWGALSVCQLKYVITITSLDTFVEDRVILYCFL